MHPREHDGAGCDQRASSDHSVVENSCVHSDKAIVLNDASVHDCTMADGHPVPDCVWGIRIGVKHCVVLDVGFSSNADRRGVGADRGTVKYARPGVDLSVAIGATNAEGSTTGVIPAIGTMSGITPVNLYARGGSTSGSPSSKALTSISSRLHGDLG
jgi:hypothetical protein